MTLLERVKTSLGVTGSYQDDTITEYINEVKGYLLEAGVPEVIINSEKSVGVIARGVADLWNYEYGKLSDYFYQRATQLLYAVVSGKIISFTYGDYGINYPITIDGVAISQSDTITFKCGDITKTFTNENDNTVIVSFTKDESESLALGTYNWTLKLERPDTVITLVSDGLLIVG